MKRRRKKFKVKAWAILDPKGNFWMRDWWYSCSGPNGAWEFLHWSEEKSVKTLMAEGYRLIPIIVKEL